jgi:GDP-mannose 6-dehydrogenase
MGYVGCVTAACLARDGFDLIGVDIDPDKVRAINAGQSPVCEPGLSELVAEQVSADRLRATLDLIQAVGESDLALVTVGTPSDLEGSVCSRAVERVVESIGLALAGTDREYTVVVRSTLLPGILEERLAPLLEEASGRQLGDNLWLTNNPEFLRESSAISDYDHPPYVVVGTLDGWEAAPVLELYPRVTGQRLVTDTRTAALLKYACNAFHALKVSFANEIGTLARSLGADGHEVMRLVCQDRKLNISAAYLRPGFAFGGSCLPKDLRAVSRYAAQKAVKLELLDAILPSNQTHLERALRLVQEGGQRNIGVVGLSFKAETDDLRESPLVILIETLLGRGYDIKIYDPYVAVSRLRGRNLAYVDRHLPHLAALLVDDPTALYDHAGLLVLGSNVADALDWRGKFRGDVLDLRRDLAVARPSMVEAS